MDPDNYENNNGAVANGTNEKISAAPSDIHTTSSMNSNNNNVNDDSALDDGLSDRLLKNYDTILALNGEISGRKYADAFFGITYDNGMHKVTNQEIFKKSIDLALPNYQQDIINKYLASHNQINQNQLPQTTNNPQESEVQKEVTPSNNNLTSTPKPINNDNINTGEPVKYKWNSQEEFMEQMAAVYDMRDGNQIATAMKELKKKYGDGKNLYQQNKQ